MDMENIILKIIQFMMDNLKKENIMALENIIKVIMQNIQGNLIIMRKKDMELNQIMTFMEMFLAIIKF